MYVKKYVNKVTRGKEIYWLQKYSMGRLESDQIQKYLRRSV